MGLESATYLSDLNTSNPVAGDNVSQGDDHLRLLKTVLQGTFPTADHAIYLERPQADVASGATTNIGAATSNFVRVTGTTTITAFDTVASGIWRMVRFAAALTLTHNASSLILPSGANITTAANDCCLAMSLGTGNWIVLWYQPATGSALVLADASVTTAKIASNAVTAVKLATSTLGPIMVNGYITAAVASNALTIAVKTLAGTDPSASDPVYAVFRNATATNGAFVVRTLTAALSLVISNGSTLGFTANQPSRLWVTIHDDGGTLRLGASNRKGAAGIRPFDPARVASSTAEGGAGAADSAQVIYTGTAVTSKAFSILGYMEWTSGLATAGVWNAAPDIVANYQMDVPLPGTVIGTTYATYTTNASLSTLIPHDNTIPQNTEGEEVISQAIVLQSPANMLHIELSVWGAPTTNGRQIGAAIFQDSTADAIAASTSGGFDGDKISATHIQHLFSPNSASPTLAVRAGPSSGAIRLNGDSSNRYFGGVGRTTLMVQELMV